MSQQLKRPTAARTTLGVPRGGFGVALRNPKATFQAYAAFGVRSTKKACNSSTMTILAPMALLRRECCMYAYYLFSSRANLHYSQRSYLLSGILKQL